MAKRASSRSAVIPLDDPLQQPAATPAPKRLDQILGQDHAIETLTSSMESGRIHHAWIFHGPKGVGKCTTALAFGALLLDASTQRTFSGTWEADPSSKAAELLAAGMHPDLHLVTKELALYDEDSQVRSRKLATIPKKVIDTHVIRRAALAAQMTGGMAAKVFIVDEAELMDRSLSNAPTQNSLLKTLEEPPDRTVIILVTSNEDRLLPTIRSRCQRVRFSPLNPMEMHQWVDQARREAAKADPAKPIPEHALLDVPNESIAWLTEFADGSPGVFLHAAKSKFHEWAAKLNGPIDSALRGTYALGLGGSMAELVEAYAKNIVETEENASKEVASRRGAEWMLRMVCSRARLGLRTIAKQRLEPGDARAEALLHALDAVREAESELDSNVNAAFVFDKLAAEMASGGA